MFYWEIHTPLVKFIRAYIRDRSGVFSISWRVRILMTSFLATARLKMLPNAVWTMASNREIKSLKPTLNRSIRNRKRQIRRRKLHMTLNYSRGFLQNKKSEIFMKFQGRAARVHVRFVRGLYFRFSSTVFVYIIKRRLHVGSKIWILCSRGKNNISFVRFTHSWDIVFATRALNSYHLATVYFFL